jgi:Flp pilus assembly protein TadG
MWWKNPRKRGGILRRFKKNQDGVSAIEFAFVGPPFIYLLCCIFETGIMLFSEYVIENGVAQAARMIRTGQVDAQGMTKSKFKDVVCGKMATFLKCNENLFVDVRSFDTFAAITIPPAIDNGELSNSVTAGAQWSPGCPTKVVVVRTYYTWKLFTPGVSKLANLSGGRRLLTSGAAFRNEPFPPSGAC